jgi:hypothetical protein
MKLPENRKERIQIFALIGIGVVAVLYAVVQLALAPLMASRQKMRDTLADQKAKMETAQRELKYAPGVQRDYDAVVRQLETIRSENVLRPILGSYLVGVTEQVEAAARGNGLRVDEVKEIGIMDLPGKAKDTPQFRPFKAYAVLVNAQGSYEAIWQFLKAMEGRNAFLCVTELQVSGQGESVARHRIAVRMEWPIESVPEPEPEKKEGEA